MWTIHKLTTTKDEGCKAHTNKGYTLPKWDTMQELMVLVHLKMNIWQVERLEVYKAQGLKPNSYNYFYTNLQILYNQHNYITNHGIQMKLTLKLAYMQEQGFWLGKDQMQFIAPSPSLGNS
jgi:hypothetical protein